jgi:hypothetical protein
MKVIIYKSKLLTCKNSNDDDDMGSSVSEVTGYVLEHRVQHFALPDHAHPDLEPIHPLTQ